MKILIRGGRDRDKFDEFEERHELPPACVDCKYYKYERGSWCEKLKNLFVYNVVTGVIQNYYGPNKCQEMRYSTHENHCGLSGRFFEPIKRG